MAVTLTDSTNQSLETKNQESSKLLGFARGLEAEKILGMHEIDGEIQFLIKWKGSDTPDFVPRVEANEKCPQVVIAYYQEKIMWMTNRSVHQIYDLEEDEESQEK